MYKTTSSALLDRVLKVAFIKSLHISYTYWNNSINDFETHLICICSTGVLHLYFSFVCFMPFLQGLTLYVELKWPSLHRLCVWVMPTTPPCLLPYVLNWIELIQSVYIVGYFGLWKLWTYLYRHGYSNLKSHKCHNLHVKERAQCQCGHPAKMLNASF